MVHWICTTMKIVSETSLVELTPSLSKRTDDGDLN